MALGVSIRGDYRRFLLEFGWGGVAGLDLYGLGPGAPVKRAAWGTDVHAR
jgi:hypothetical protein